MKIEKWVSVEEMSVEEFEWQSARNALADRFLEEVVFGDRP